MAAEDTKVNETQVESTNKDTVEWAESTKTLVSGTEKKEDSYEKVDGSKITDPATKSARSFMLLEKKMEPTEPGDGTGTGEGTPTATPEPIAKPTLEPAGETNTNSNS